ncbi:MAG: hypothetical protein H7Z41_09050 [Cytophagales bacterium]|nr:hypothetical protein [Armatimonadota bacterium]
MQPPQLPRSESAMTDPESEKRPTRQVQGEAGWGRTTMSTFYHWFDAVESKEAGLPRRSICAMLTGYRGDTVAAIKRWESDPSVCEICSDILKARAKGKISPNHPARTIAIVPVGLPDRVLTFFRAASARGENGPPFQQTLTEFRADGVSKQFLQALLRYDALRRGRPWNKALRWGDIELDELREVDGTVRVRLVREPIL